MMSGNGVANPLLGVGGPRGAWHRVATATTCAMISLQPMPKRSLSGTRERTNSSCDKKRRKRRGEKKRRGAVGEDVGGEGQSCFIGSTAIFA